MRLHDFITKEKKLKAKCIQSDDKFTKGKTYWVQPVDKERIGQYNNVTKDLPFNEAPYVRVVNDEGKLVWAHKHLFVLLN